MLFHKLLRTKIKGDILNSKLITQIPSHNFANNAQRASGKINGGKNEIEDEERIRYNMRFGGSLINAPEFDSLFKGRAPRGEWSRTCAMVEALLQYITRYGNSK